MKSNEFAKFLASTRQAADHAAGRKTLKTTRRKAKPRKAVKRG